MLLENNYPGQVQDHRYGSVQMTTLRTYGDGCAIAHGLDLVGERWALLVVRELLLGPKRNTDLRRGLPGASPNVLSERLRELERAGVVRRRKLPPPAGSRVYELTDWGRELEQIMISLGRWADQADATIDTDLRTLDRVLWGGRPLADAQRAGTMTIEGDAAAVERFVRLFPAPEPAAAVSPG
jgi:DNA-binding HxlR family transcriptional regulator